MAEMSVPAWPIPIHQTKFTIAKPHATGIVTPHVPVPSAKRYVTDIPKMHRKKQPTPKASHHAGGCGRSMTTDPTASEMEKRLDGLRRRLHRAIEVEDFERAAEVRDQIQSLEPA